jgi:serine/threonine protein kinase
MVYLPGFKTSDKCLVLYSLREDAWKIADFGLTTEATSNILETRHSRGTSGYRPPELLRDHHCTYTNKVDIWAMGCLLYEIVVRKPAFVDDFTVRHYFHKFSRSSGSLKIPVDLDENRNPFIQEALDEMLQIEPPRRPSAQQIHDRFSSWAEQNTVSDRSAVETSILDKSPRRTIPVNERSIQTSGYFIAIDFGTTHTGVALAPSSYCGEPFQSCANVIELVKTWPSFLFAHADKTPSLLEYNERQEYVAWGGRVKPAEALSVAYFKSGLQETSKADHLLEGPGGSVVGGFLERHSRNTANNNWRHPKLPQKTAVDFVSDYLMLVKRHALFSIFNYYPIAAHMVASYSITVPVFWADKAVDLTRQAAIKAGIPEKDLILITEPEAAACFSAKLYDECGLRAGDPFLVCVAGGGTVVNFTIVQEP